MLAEILRHAMRSRYASGGQTLGDGLGLADPLFYLADRGEILVNLAAVIHAEPFAQRSGIVQYYVEYAFLVQFTFVPFGGRNVSCRRAAEKPVKDQRRG